MVLKYQREFGVRNRPSGNRLWADKPEIVYSKTTNLLWERGRFDHKTGAGGYEYKPHDRKAPPHSSSTI